VVPSTGEEVTFDSFATANLSTVLNQDFSILGINVTNPAGPVSIGGTNILTIGANGIDLSLATQNLTITAPVVLGAAQSWSVASGRTLSVNGGVSGGFSLTITGTGKVSLGGAVTYTGSTTIDFGSTLFMGASNVLPNGASAGGLVVNGTLDLNGTAQAINGLSGTGIVDNTGGGSATLTVGNNDVASTFSGSLQNTSGTLALFKTGSGNLTLSAASTHSGGFTNNGTGLVFPQNNNAFGIGPVVMNGSTIYATTANYTFTNSLALNGATLRVGGGSSRTLIWNGSVSVTGSSGISADGSTAGITLAGGLNMNTGGHTFTSYASGTANTISAPISGGNGTIMVTLGTLNLNAVNTFGGTYRSSVGGPLKIGDALAMQNATLDMNAADAGTVNLNNLNATLGALTGSRSLSLGNGTVSIGNNNLSTTYSGNLSGTGGSLVKIGNGTLTLSGNNTYTGTTGVNAGTLALGASNVLPATAVSIGNATLDAANFTDTTGTLDVTTATSKINLGTGAALAFADSSGVDWTGGTLNITGTFVSGSSLRFGTSSTGLTSTQLAKISASGFGPFFMNANGYLIVDTTPPTLVAIVDNKGGAPITVNTLVTYTVAFSEDMNASTVTAASFGNAGTASVTIGSVTETTSTSGVFIVQATPISTGTLQIKVNAGAVLKDVAGNNLNTASAILDDTTITVQTPYAAWASGGAFNADANNDGVPNGVAWVLGAANPSANANGLLPIFDNTTDPTYFIFTYRRSDAAYTDANTTIAVQYGSDLSVWTNAVHDGTNIIITPTNDGAGAGVDSVQVKIKRTLAVGSKIFVRLNVVLTP
jgi:autotransporter-associated beta strand protein